MKKIIYIFLISILCSCEDVVNIENNIEKELLVEILSPSDSLSKLTLSGFDGGRIKMMGTHHEYISIKDTSAKYPITIYEIDHVNKTGLFEFTYPNGLPIILQPGEDTKDRADIHLKFLAKVLNTGYQYDTLIINGNEDYKYPIRFYVYY